MYKNPKKIILIAVTVIIVITTAAGYVLWNKPH